jgi:PIN domain nuclease of toxin-antitoxin system
MLKSWIEFVNDTSNELFLSIGSIWEIAIKSAKGKLDIKSSISALIEDHVLKRRIEILSINAEHLDQVQLLPHHHKDPFDRLIIAQSIVENLKVLTVDPNFKLYGINLIQYDILILHHLRHPPLQAGR